MANYITVAEVNAEGLVDPPFTDADITAAIVLWQQFLERACRQFFESRTLTIEFDGNDSDTIHFGIPIISVEYLKINDDTTNLSTDLFKIYSSRSYPDDRRNPRIKLIPDTDLDIYTAPQSTRRLKFRKGRQNCSVKGAFGFTESDGSVPLLIKRAWMKLVIEKLANPLYVADPATAPTPPPLMTGILLEEKTDGHSMRYGAAGGTTKPRAPGLIGITSDQEILDIIRLYKAAIGIATPAGWSYS